MIYKIARVIKMCFNAICNGDLRATCVINQTITKLFMHHNEMRQAMTKLYVSY